MSMCILYRVHYIHIHLYIIYIIYDVCMFMYYVVIFFYFSSGWQQRRRFRFSAAVRHRDTAGWTSSKGEGEHHTCI